MASTSTVAVLPGTGRMGSGFALRFARAGHRVLLGSRETSKAQTAADKILSEFPNANIQAGKIEDLPLSSVGSCEFWTHSAGRFNHLVQSRNHIRTYFSTEDSRVEGKDNSRCHKHLLQVQRCQRVWWKDQRN